MGKTAMQAVIELPVSLLENYSKILRMTGPQLYQKYGLKRDETFTHTASFANGYEADIKLVICEEDTPFVDAVLFNQHGGEVTCVLGDGDVYHGVYRFENQDGQDYVVIVRKAQGDE